VGLVSGVFIAIQRPHVPNICDGRRTIIAVELTAWWQTCVNGASKKSALGILNQMGLDLIPSFPAPPAYGERSPWPHWYWIDRPIPWPKDFSGRRIYPDGRWPHFAHEREICASRVLTPPDAVGSTI